MTVKEIKEKLIETLQEVQDMSGEKKVVIMGNTKPIKGLPGFDSARGVEVTNFFLQKTGLDDDEKIKNLFVSDDGTRALTVDEASIKMYNAIK